MREHRDGVAFLVFDVDCDWEVEHGMYVAYHPATGAKWATADGLDDLLKPGGADPAGPPGLPGHLLMYYAVLAGDEAKVRELTARGHDLNDQGGGPQSPLALTIQRLDVELAQAAARRRGRPEPPGPPGEDCAATGPRAATGVHRSKGAARPPESGDALTKAAMAFTAQVYRRDLPKVEAIIRVLEAAGAA